MIRYRDVRTLGRINSESSVYGDFSAFFLVLVEFFLKSHYIVTLQYKCTRKLTLQYKCTRTLTFLFLLA